MTTRLSTPILHSRAGVADGFRRAREAAGMSHRALASLLGTSAAAVIEIEAGNNVLFTRYSPADIRVIAGALGLRPPQLLACPADTPPLPGEELLERIRTGLKDAPGRIEDFEDEAGWRVGRLLDSPEHLLTDLTVEALQQLCGVLDVDWRRVIAAL